MKDSEMGAYSFVRFVRPRSWLGIVPSNQFESRYSSERVKMEPNSTWIVPVNELFVKPLKIVILVCNYNFEEKNKINK